MPVSYFPLLLPLLFVVLLAQGAIRGWRALIHAIVIVCLILAMVLLPFYIPGWILMWRVRGGDPHVMYQLAKWHENHSDGIGEIILWPFQPDVLGGYAWVERAAEKDYPPALYAIGVRLKHGLHVPKPAGWTGPGGNVFEQPERGQKYIDKAIELGYTPLVDENMFYDWVYREMYVKDPNG